MIQGLLYLQTSSFFMCVIIISHVLYLLCVFVHKTFCGAEILAAGLTSNWSFFALSLLQCVSSTRKLPSDFLRLWGSCTFGALFFVRHPAFPSRDRVKASSADTQGAAFSDLKLSARTENWIPAGEYAATSSDYSNLHFLGPCWRLLKSGTLFVLGIIFSTAFFFFSIFFFFF